LPDLETVLRETPDEGLAVVAVNNGERFEPSLAYIDDIEVTLTAFAWDPTQAIVRLYDLQGMPTSYLIDAEGVITRGVTRTGSRP
jgi:hypothetical protein